jgi:hypothetical protein
MLNNYAGEWFKMRQADIPAVRVVYCTIVRRNAPALHIIDITRHIGIKAHNDAIRSITLNSANLTALPSPSGSSR